MRIIDGDVLVAESTFFVKDEDGFDVAVVLVSDIETAPTIDPEELRPKGEWIGEADGYADGELVYDVWYCSECDHCIDDGTDDPELLPNYCPNCGVKMRGVNDGVDM